MDLDKVKEIVEWPTLTNLTQLREFVGLCGFYHKFFNGYSCHATPLTDLTKKGAFVWTREAQECFEMFKQLMTTCLLLALSNFTKPFQL